MCYSVCVCVCVCVCVLGVLHHPLTHAMLPPNPAKRLCNVLSDPIYLFYLALLPEHECTVGVAGSILHVAASYCEEIHRIILFFLSFFFTPSEAVIVVSTSQRSLIKENWSSLSLCLVLAVFRHPPVFHTKHITALFQLTAKAVRHNNKTR